MEGWTRGNYFWGFLKYADSGRSFEERPVPRRPTGHQLLGADLTGSLSLVVCARCRAAVLALKRLEGGQMLVIVDYGAKKEQASL